MKVTTIMLAGTNAGAIYVGGRFLHCYCARTDQGRTTGFIAGLRFCGNTVEEETVFLRMKSYNLRWPENLSDALLLGELVG